jgi:glycosyltransferase involved in cell wall biosynthesis
MSRRIVIITELIAPYRIPVFNALAQRNGIDLHVIFLSETDYSQRQWRVYKDEIRFPYEVLSSWRRRLGRRNFLLNWGLETALRQARPDFIICGGYNYVASWQSKSWARRNDVAFSLWCESTSRDFRKGYRLTEFYKKQFFRHCDAFVVPGKSSSEYLKDFGVPEQLIFTAPNAVDTELFANRANVIRQAAATYREALRLPPRFFLYAGRLVREKGIFDLLHAYDTLPAELRKEVGLVFVGDGPERSALRQQATAIHSASIHFVGFAHREDLAAYYGLADVFVFPTHTDRWGLVVNEAMACGLPIIASDAAGCVADLVEDGANGRVVPVGNVQQLACAMEELALNAGLRALMCRRSRERIQQYSPEAWADGMANAVMLQRKEAA